MTIEEAIAWAQTLGVPRLDAQLLVLHALGRDDTNRAWLIAHSRDPLPDAAQHRLQTAALRRAGGEPLAYITGYKEFYGLRLQVDARVLDPRADTETLVDWALALPLPVSPPLHHQQPTDADGPEPADMVRVLDLGTGSGAVALAIKHQRSHWQVEAIDCSADALAVARANAGALGLTVHFTQGSWLNGAQGRFDAIVSNPPYIATQDPHLPALQHEPMQALVSGNDGLDDIRTIIAQAPAHLTPGGWLLLEHGYDQAAKVRALLTEAGFSAVQSRKDLGGIERCSGGCWPA